MCIDKLDDIVNKYNNTYHSAIKIKPVNIKSRTHIDFGRDNNKKDPEFKVGDHIRMSKHRNISTVYTSNWTKDIFCH